MTVSAAPAATTALGTAAPRRTGYAFASDGSYAACLVESRPDSGEWFPERWTLGGPEPYTVPLPGQEPEDPACGLLPLPDGRVLIRRPGPEGHRLALLYPAGPDTAEVPVGTLDLDDVRLLPLPLSGPRPASAAWRTGPALAFALGTAQDGEGGRTSSVWLVSTGSPEPELVTEFPGGHTGGIWLDRAGRLLALDETAGGRTRTVVLDMDSGRPPTPLLQLAPESNDRLLLADPDSGLLVVRSDAPGTERVGWGVLGSKRPFRFPECLRLPDAEVTPFAVQPGAALTPEDCGVALRVDGIGEIGGTDRMEGMDGLEGPHLAVWRPAHGVLHQVAAPRGWLVGTGHWSADGLRLPFATADCPFGVATMAVEAVEGAVEEESAEAVAEPVPEVGEAAGAADTAETVEPAEVSEPAESIATAGYGEPDGAVRPVRPAGPVGTAEPGERATNKQPDQQHTAVNGVPEGAGSPSRPPLRTPVPLQQAPLATVGA